MTSTTAPRLRVVLGVGGGIAAYKACELLRLFTEAGHDVSVAPTAAALRFVGEPTWEALSGKPVGVDVFTDVPAVRHVRMGQEADLVVVAPATADLLAKAAHGLADDLLTATLLTARCPVVFAPAMHTEMWLHPATRANVEVLRSRAVHVIEPADGRLTGRDSGPGRLPDPDLIFREALAAYERERGAAVSDSAGGTDLQGRRVVVSAGGTREYLDPVRFLGNRSSGKQGVALAAAARRRGAAVTLVAAHVEVPLPDGVEVVRVGTTRELQDAITRAAPAADAVVMAAAPADFRPADAAEHKIKKVAGQPPPSLTLVENPDVLAGLAADRGTRPAPVLVGFAAETGDPDGSALEHARKKLARKGCDLLVLNDVSDGRVFGSDENQAVILGRDGSETATPRGSKAQLADAIWDRVVPLLAPRAND